MIPSANCIALIKRFESCSLTAYHGADDPPGLWTIGWGHTGNVQEGEEWSQAQADATLQADAQIAANAVARLVDVAISQGQADALTDFVFNEGTSRLASSTLLRLLNSGNYSDAADQLLVWDIANGAPSEGLESRRKAEQALFLGESV